MRTQETTMMTTQQPRPQLRYNTHLIDLRIRIRQLTETINLRNLQAQFQQTSLALMLSIAIVTLILFAIYLFSNYFDISPDTLTRDPAAVTHTPSYFGILSSVGSILWGVTVALCLFGYTLIPPSSYRIRWFLLGSALFSAILGIDDLIMLHDGILSDVPYAEMVLYAGYAIFAMCYVFLFAEVILNSQYLLLGITFVCFFLSMSIDQILPPDEIITFIEDGFKFMGIIMWVLYFYKTTVHFIKESLKETKSS